MSGTEREILLSTLNSHVKHLNNERLWRLVAHVEMEIHYQEADEDRRQKTIEMSQQMTGGR